jgi:hypothetical protein
LAQSRFALPGSWGHRRSVNLLTEGLLHALDHLGHADTDDDQSHDRDDHPPAGPRQHPRRGTLWDFELDDPEPSATKAALTPSAA